MPDELSAAARQKIYLQNSPDTMVLLVEIPDDGYGAPFPIRLCTNSVDVELSNGDTYMGAML